MLTTYMTTCGPHNDTDWNDSASKPLCFPRVDARNSNMPVEDTSPEAACGPVTQWREVKMETDLTHVLCPQFDACSLSVKASEKTH